MKKAMLHRFFFSLPFLIIEQNNVTWKDRNYYVVLNYKEVNRSLTCHFIKGAGWCLHDGCFIADTAINSMCQYCPVVHRADKKELPLKTREWFLSRYQAKWQAGSQNLYRYILKGLLGDVQLEGENAFYQLFNYGVFLSILE